MADDSVSENAGGADTYSKEYVDKLKAEMTAKSEEHAKLKAFKNSHDEKQRAVITTLQPDINEFVGSLVQSNSDHASEMQAIVDWGKSCHESASLETAMPLARVLSCASAQFKRTREEASVSTERANTLNNTMKELEEVKAADSAKAQRISELEALCNERQEGLQKMQEELAKAGVLKEKFDFSKLASREKNAQAKEGAPGSVAEATAGSSSLSTTTTNASRRVEDELMSFVSSTARGLGSHKIAPSGTGHSHLGAPGGSLEEEIQNAFRGY